MPSVLALSGRHGLFADRLAREQARRPNVSWVDKGDLTSAAYYTAACAEAQSKGTALAFRLGGGNSLGLCLQTNEFVRSVGVWRVTGVPFGWSEEELQSVLLNSAWENVEIVSPPRYRKQPWLVRAKPPASLVGMVGAVHVDDDLLVLQRALQKSPKSASSSRLDMASRPVAQSQVVIKPMEVETVAETQEEEPSQDVEMQGSKDAQQDSPAGGAAKRASSPKMLLLPSVLRWVCRLMPSVG